MGVQSTAHVRRYYGPRRGINEKPRKELRKKSVTSKVKSPRLDMLEGAKSIGAGAATIALAGAAVGIGNVLSSSIHSVARNPSLAKQLFGYAILGFALTEAHTQLGSVIDSLVTFAILIPETVVFNSQVKDDFFVGETMGGRKHASDSPSRSSFPTPRETGRDR